ncbi:glucosyltransferase domain-containing protein [Acetobacter orleanensis]|nr:glucosyltransferase domain-containing protein [Acetobacter orleanensis]PCD80096.1 hypothetical protein CO710_04420 [Acetobacter orleanensis]GAN68431.1 hypothetical protein Abol_015_270 [Acetobacter orleanensis JCM 7639]
MDQSWPKLHTRHVWLLFILSCLFALPIFLANAPYMDDNARALYGYTWSHSGRIFSTALMNALSLRTHNIPDLAPLGQILGLLALSGSGALLAARLLRGRRMDDLSVCLCALPLAVQPFFLENLSYKFDALPMLMAQTCAVLAALVPEGWSGRRNFATCSAFLFALLCFYQPALNTFLALSVLLFMSDTQQAQDKAAWRGMGLRVGALGVAYAAYHVLIVRHFVGGSYAAPRSETMSLHNMLHGLLWDNVQQAFFLLASLLHGGPGLILCAFYVLGAFCVWSDVLPAMRRRGIIAKLNGVVLVSVPFLLLLLVPGIVLILVNTVLSPRIFMAFSGCVILANLFFIQTAVGQRFRWLAIIPLLYFYVVSFSFGNTMTAQEQFQRAQAERLANQLDDAGFQKGDDLFVYGTEAQAPIVQNAIAGMPYLAELLPRQQISDDALFGYARLRQVGVDSREHTPEEWEAARSLLKPANLVHETPKFAVYRDGTKFALRLTGA